MAEEPIAQECVEGYLYALPPLSLLLLRRPPSRGGIWVPVSGKVEPSDRDLPSALLREIAEETGLSPPTPPWPLDWHLPFTGPDGRRWRLHAYGVELGGRYPPRLSAEHDSFAWVSAQEAIARLHYEDNQEAVRRLLARLVPPSGAGEGRARASRES